MRDVVKIFLFFHLFIWTVGAEDSEDVPTVAEIDLETKQIVVNHRQEKEASAYSSYSQEQKAELERKFLAKMDGMKRKIELNASAAQGLAKKRIEINSSMRDLEEKARALGVKKRKLRNAWRQGNDAELTSWLGSRCTKHSNVVTCQTLNLETKELLGLDPSNTDKHEISISEIDVGLNRAGADLAKKTEALREKSATQEDDLKRKYGFRIGDFHEQKTKIYC